MKPDDKEIRSERIRIRKVDNGYILKFVAKQSSISTLRLDYDWNTHKTEVYSTLSEAEARIEFLFSPTK